MKEEIDQLDTRVFDVFSNGIGRSEGKELRHLFHGYTDMKMLNLMLELNGVDSPYILIMTVVATVRNLLDDELINRKKEEEEQCQIGFNKIALLLNTGRHNWARIL